MKTYKIEKEVALPPMWDRSTYPFEEMEIGDSFFVPGRENCERVRAMASYKNKSHMKKFIIRTFSDGIRVWRIE